MGHRQKGKHMKRKKSWHRGRVEAVRWERVMRQIGKKLGGDEHG